MSLSAIISSISCGSSSFLDKRTASSFSFRCSDELALSLMVKSVYFLSVEVELESLLGFAALVGIRIGFHAMEQSRSHVIFPSKFSQVLPPIKLNGRKIYNFLFPKVN